MKLNNIKTKILDKQHQLLAVDFGSEWLSYLQEQANTKQGEDKSDLLAGECSYQPEWLEQKDWIKYLCEQYHVLSLSNISNFLLTCNMKMAKEISVKSDEKQEKVRENEIIEMPS